MKAVRLTCALGRQRSAFRGKRRQADGRQVKGHDPQLTYKSRGVRRRKPGSTDDDTMTLNRIIVYLLTSLTLFTPAPTLSRSESLLVTSAPYEA